MRLIQQAPDVMPDESEIVAGARRLGYDIDSVWDFVNNSPHPTLPRRFVGPYERAYPLLIEHLTRAHHPRVREGIIRALTIKDGGEPKWTALHHAFMQEQDALMR